LKVKEDRKTIIHLNNMSSSRLTGSWDCTTWLRGRLKGAVDPMNLNQVILAEGKEK